MPTTQERSRLVVNTGWELVGGRWPCRVQTSGLSQRIAWLTLRGAIAALVDGFDGRRHSARVPIAIAVWQARGWILNDEWGSDLTFADTCGLLGIDAAQLRSDLLSTGVLGVPKFKNYPEWVRIFGFCVVCNSRPENVIDFDHRPTRGARGRVNHDRGCPVCRKHHSEAHSIGIETFQRKYRIDMRVEEEAWRARYARWLERHGFDMAKAVPVYPLDASTKNMPWKRHKANTGKKLA